jgi:hypothetical protein
MNRPEEDVQPAQIRELVSKYCRMDYEGARLDPQQWTKLEPIVWWRSNPDYTQINVISRYTVDAEPVSNHGKYTVTVHYRLLGTFDLTTGYVPETGGANQDVSFVVTTENKEWRISDAENTFPHPSRIAMVKWLTEKMNTIQDEVVKTRYQNALNQLQQKPVAPMAQ